MNGARVTGCSLTKRFGHAVALDQLSLELAPGESLAVLGPNGAGKSTLLRLLAGLARPNAGTIEIDGAPAHRRSARRRIGYIGHATLLYPALTARENLVFAARLYGVPDPAERAAQLLEDAELGAAADEQVAGFSRGMAQRAAIARGLVHDPALVLLDEPFTGLDRSASERLLVRLATLRREGRSLVLVTHELAHAAQLADASLVLAKGRTVHTGRGEDAASLEDAYLAAVERAA
ncbi:MAG: heme ABC exporter ATP-binding protein CcmA [Deltaproteobacteria bacterium]|nr:heme ABC exporter ATP-binding protein CcmA [Deltaproteobacteria bacterium]MBW2361372.1 heme ABC exporter ATP-binding protein CcmA [Deltaproteobacteria bacterium]